MPGFLADYANSIALDLLFGGIPTTPPGVWYFGLSRQPANKRGWVYEPDGASYRRIATPNTSDSFLIASNGCKANKVSIVFPTPQEDWGIVTTIFAADSLSGGNIWAIADLSSPIHMNTGCATTRISPGAWFHGDSDYSPSPIPVPPTPPIGPPPNRH